MNRVVLLVAIFLLFAAGFWWWQRDVGADTAVSANITSFLTAEDPSGFARATEPGAIQFPRDLGAHPDYQTEWWYYTGNLQTADGREFGYQFTIFRRALSPAPETSASQSEWRTNQVYSAHFTISDIASSQFYQQEKFSRGSAGLAGTQAEPYHVWIEDWSAEEIGPQGVRLTAKSEEVALDVELTQTLPPILHGDAGLSQKGPEPGNASYYYSFVQQPTVGTVRIGSQTFDVQGVSWKDHEYSTSALTRDSVGWDWFSVQLETGAALMMGQIRQADGRISPFSGGTFVAADGTTTPLTAADIKLTVADYWRSPTTHISYPAKWEIGVPKMALTLTAVPLMPDQELTLSTIYWEGAVAYDGLLAGEPISGRGYVELTGYGSPFGDQR